MKILQHEALFPTSSPFPTLCLPTGKIFFCFFVLQLGHGFYSDNEPFSSESIISTQFFAAKCNAVQINSLFNLGRTLYRILQLVLLHPHLSPGNELANVIRLFKQRRSFWKDS